MGKGCLLICGDGPTLEADLLRWDAFEAPRHDVCAVNRAGFKLGRPFQFWYSFHVGWLLKWDAAYTGEKAYRLVSCQPSEGLDQVTELKLEFHGGSSTLQAARAAVHVLGYDQVVIAGAPFSGRYDALFGPAVEAAGRNKAFADKVFGMSGLPLQVFGPPPWVEGLD